MHTVADEYKHKVCAAGHRLTLGIHCCTDSIGTAQQKCGALRRMVGPVWQALILGNCGAIYRQGCKTDQTLHFAFSVFAGNSREICGAFAAASRGLNATEIRGVVTGRGQILAVLRNTSCNTNKIMMANRYTAICRPMQHKTVRTCFPLHRHFRSIYFSQMHL